MVNKVDKIVVFSTSLNDERRKMITDITDKYDISVNFYDSTEDAIDNLKGADVVFGNNPDLIENAPDLKWFCSATAGINHYIDALTGRDVILTNSAGSYGLSISEHIIMASLMMMRRMHEYNNIIANKQWKNDLKIRSLAGSKIVVLGTGNLGYMFAKRVRGFDPEYIIGVSRSGKHVDGFDKVVEISQLNDVLSDVDLLVMCLPGTPETANIINEERLALMPDTAYIVNVGRGTSIDEDALMDAVNNGRLAGAALDVLREEPLPEDSPLWTTPGIYITPHISGQETLDWTINNTFRMFSEDLENYIEGRPLAHLADITLGY